MSSHYMEDGPMKHRILVAAIAATLSFSLGACKEETKLAVKEVEKAESTQLTSSDALITPAEKAAKEFKGKIDIDIRKSKADWEPYMPKAAPSDAPNVLIVLYDDTGLAAWSPYGGAINMPTLDKIAENGLTYTQFHTTALCSPTRSTLLTGRNHHVNGFASISEATNGFPGQHGRLPEQTATMAEVLQENGWSTFWVGKNHNLPETDVAEGASRKSWPLQQGFDRFYGFLGGETNNWYPDLVEDNHFIDQPYMPEDGYHLSKDLADQAIKMIRNQKASNPSKPWFMWFNPGANHAPHHSPKDYADKYKGVFDDGYEVYREWVLERMKKRGIVPATTKLTPINPMPKDMADPNDAVRPWDSLSADEKKLFVRMAEVYAGFSEYTDAQVGRMIDYLEKSKQLENTIILYAADNGASGEGTPNGSVNENKFFNGWPDKMEENMKYLDVLGGPETYNHYPTGWAAAFSSPFQMFKRYSQFAGGTGDPLVISWPKGIKARGELRHQYHHSVDIVPTILELTGLEMPEVFKGVPQYPLNGVSMAYSFDATPDAKTQKEVQYYTMFGTRGIWKDGWKAVAMHAPFGKGNFEHDRWELYNVEEDRSESTDLSAQYPEKLEALKKEWYKQAQENLVLPLDDRTPLEILTTYRPTTEKKRERFIYFPDTAPVPEGVAANVRGRSYKILANVEITKGSDGVLFAHGSRFGGHSLFIKDGKLNYVYNFLGIDPEQKFTSKEKLKPGKYTLGVEFIKESSGKHGESIGKAKLYIDDKVVAEGPMRTQPGKFTLSGDGLCIGYDSGDAVSKEYQSPGRFKGGNIDFVGITVEGTDYIDLEQEARRMLMKH
ncbi:sulfatase-like hydrolase/transferase [Agaribacterium sp. ZY112]|uniref:sulfatase-like hydrolase/transferase n=1 Tax=Agaribacterium sp. ZY112 TaxID=3233574 RepID=UPI003525A2F4